MGRRPAGSSKTEQSVPEPGGRGSTGTAQASDAGAQAAERGGWEPRLDADEVDGQVAHQQRGEEDGEGHTHYGAHQIDHPAAGRQRGGVGGWGEHVGKVSTCQASPSTGYAPKGAASAGIQRHPHAGSRSAQTAAAGSAHSGTPAPADLGKMGAERMNRL